MKPEITLNAWTAVSLAVGEYIDGKGNLKTPQSIIRRAMEYGRYITSVDDINAVLCIIDFGVLMGKEDDNGPKAA